MSEPELPIEDWVSRIKNKQLLIAMCELHAVRYGCRFQMARASGNVLELPNLAYEKKLLNNAIAYLKDIQGGWDHFPMVMLEDSEINDLPVNPAALYGRADFLYEYVKRNLRELDRE